MKKIYLFLILSFLFSQDDYYEYILTSEIQEYGHGYSGNIFCNSTQFATTFIDLHSTRIFELNLENEWHSTQNLISEFNIQILSMNDENLIKANGYSHYNYEQQFEIYNKEEQGWELNTLIANPDTLTYFSFGVAAHINEDWLLVKSISPIENSEEFNYLHIYHNEFGNWEPWNILTFDKNISNNFYIDSEQLIFKLCTLIGVDGQPTCTENEVQIWKMVNENWIFDTSLNIELENTSFGIEIEYNDEFLFISDIQSSDYAGAVDVYKKINGDWIQTQILTASNGNQNDNFGIDISTYGDYLAIGAPQNEDAGWLSGSIYFFQLNQNGMWEEIRVIYSSDIEPLDAFGTSICLNDEYLFAITPLKHNLTGAIYIYDIDDTMLHSNFATYPVTGNAPLSLNFNDLSQGNPTSWQWDFDSDGIIDSEEQYPEHTYEFSGDYTVTLTVSNTEETSNFTKENYISVTGGLAYGDLNDDSIVNILDILIMVDVIIGEINLTESQIEAADMNNSGTIDIIDIVMVVNEILGE